MPRVTSSQSTHHVGKEGRHIHRKTSIFFFSLTQQSIKMVSVRSACNRISSQPSVILTCNGNIGKFTQTDPFSSSPIVEYGKMSSTLSMQMNATFFRSPWTRGRRKVAYAVYDFLFFPPAVVEYKIWCQLRKESLSPTTHT